MQRVAARWFLLVGAAIAVLALLFARTVPFAGDFGRMAPSPSRADTRSQVTLQPADPQRPANGGYRNRFAVRSLADGALAPGFQVALEREGGWTVRLTADGHGLVTHQGDLPSTGGFVPEGPPRWAVLSTLEDVRQSGVLWVGSKARLRVIVSVEGSGSRVEDADSCEVEAIFVGVADAASPPDLKVPWSPQWMSARGQAGRTRLQGVGGGEFTAEVLAVAGLVIRARCNGYYQACAPAPAPTGGEESSSPIRLTLRRARELRGRLLDTMGGAVAPTRATVYLHFEPASTQDWLQLQALCPVSYGASIQPSGRHTVTGVLDFGVGEDGGFAVVLPIEAERVELVLHTARGAPVRRSIVGSADVGDVRVEREDLRRVLLRYRGRVLRGAGVVVTDLRESPLQTSVDLVADEQGRIPANDLERDNAYWLVIKGVDVKDFDPTISIMDGFIVWDGRDEIDFAILPQSFEDVVPRDRR